MDFTKNEQNVSSLKLEEFLKIFFFGLRVLLKTQKNVKKISP